MEIAIDLLLGIIVTYIILNNFYQYWFNFENFRDRYILQMERWPAWYPFRNYYLRRAQQDGFRTEGRFLTCLTLIVPIVGWTVIVIKYI